MSVAMSSDGNQLSEAPDEERCSAHDVDITTPTYAPASSAMGVNAFNGVSVGRGHLAEAKAAVNKELAGAKSAFARGGNGVVDNAQVEEKEGCS